MADTDSLAEPFEESAATCAAWRRMLGSLAEADDAVQEAWLRLSRRWSPDRRTHGTTCHDTPNTGNHSVKAPLNIG